jgi:hypothetical protein
MYAFIQNLSRRIIQTVSAKPGGPATDADPLSAVQGRPQLN